MRRQIIAERPDWQGIAERSGFTFHHNGGEKYWNEGAAYIFHAPPRSKNDIEAPSAEIHAMCLDLVTDVVGGRAAAGAACHPRAICWDLVANSWRNRERPRSYGRFDFVYDGNGPAQLLEYNADTPTSIYETGYYQWQWLEDMIAAGRLPRKRRPV